MPTFQEDPPAKIQAPCNSQPLSQHQTNKHYDSDVCVRTLNFFYTARWFIAVWKETPWIRTIKMFSGRWNVAPYFKCNPLWVYTTADMELFCRRLQHSQVPSAQNAFQRFNCSQLFATPKSCVKIKADLQAFKTRFHIKCFKRTSLCFVDYLTF